VPGRPSPSTILVKTMVSAVVTNMAPPGLNRVLTSPRTVVDMEASMVPPVMEGKSTVVDGSRLPQAMLRAMEGLEETGKKLLGLRGLTSMRRMRDMVRPGDNMGITTDEAENKPVYVQLLY